MGMKQVAELGYFLVKLIERFKLDETVGVESGHPQVWFLPNNPPRGEGQSEEDRSIRSANETELD